MGTTPPSKVSLDPGSSSGGWRDSMMELERPGEEKKKRLEAKTVAKSGGGTVSKASSESDVLAEEKE
ncbi:hypothetical protein Syun_007342 [Stephania yunnanensis]|uniref:Uncharacterized protein n=1 Tax=Stephania yunnanensis TaxID=152371 RepID=A0AAP0KYF0_9MAGN